MVTFDSSGPSKPRSGSNDIWLRGSDLTRFQIPRSYSLFLRYIQGFFWSKPEVNNTWWCGISVSLAHLLVVLSKTTQWVLDLKVYSHNFGSLMDPTWRHIWKYLKNILIRNFIYTVRWLLAVKQASPWNNLAANIIWPSRSDLFAWPRVILTTVVSRFVSISASEVLHCCLGVLVCACVCTCSVWQRHFGLFFPVVVCFESFVFFFPGVDGERLWTHRAGV